MFTLNIHTDNDAFQPNVTAEVARILRETADRVENGEIAAHYRTVFDSNGNDCGRVRLTGDN